MLNSRSSRLNVETLEARLVPSLTVLDLTTRGAIATAPSGAIVQQGDTQTQSHGRTFLRIDDRGTEQGYNTDARRYQFDEECGTRALRLDRVPVVMVNGVAYREFRLNVNQNWWSSNISLDELRIYLGDSGNLRGYNSRTQELAGMSAAFDLDDGGNVSVLVNGRLNRGCRSTDMVLLIPDAAFAGGGEFVYLFSKFGGLRGASANGGAEEWSVRCHAEPPPSPPPPPPPPTGGTLSGRVWFDANQNGFFDVDDETGDPIDHGIGGVVIRLDAIIDGQEVKLEAITDPEGYYSFESLMAGIYTLSEDQPRINPADPDGEFYADGQDYLGSIEGADESTWGAPETPDRFAAIQLGTNQNAVGYIFTEQFSDNH